MKKLIFTSIISSVIMFLFLACPPNGDEPAPPALSGILITNDESDLTLSVGETVDLIAVVTPTGASAPTLSWNSADDTRATVSSNGKVTARAVTEGVIITVATTPGDYTATAKIVINAVAPPDNTPPDVAYYAFTSDTTILIGFSELLNEVSAESTQNYVFSGFSDNDTSGNALSENPASVVMNSKSVTLTFSEALTDGDSFILTINGIKDVAGNFMSNPYSETFSYSTVPEPANLTSIEISEGQISGNGRAIPVSENGFNAIYATLAGASLSMESIIAIQTSIGEDGSFPALESCIITNNNPVSTGNPHTFSSGNYQLYVQDTKYSLSSPITVTVP